MLIYRGPPSLVGLGRTLGTLLAKPGLIAVKMFFKNNSRLRIKQIKLVTFRGPELPIGLFLVENQIEWVYCFKLKVVRD